MAWFDYTGQLATGATFEGSLDAETAEAAEATLLQMGVRSLSVRSAKRRSATVALSLDDLTFFNDQLATMTSAGVPLPQGLRQLAADVASGRLKRVLLAVAGDLERGVALDRALQDRGVPAQYAGVFQAGLRSGDLGGALYGLATHLRLKSDLKRAIIEIAVYPLAVLAATTMVLEFMMRQVVPQILSVVGEAMQFSVKPMAVAVLDSVVESWPIVEMIAGGVAAAMILLIVVINLPGMSGLRELVFRMIPGVAQVYWASVLARFTHITALGAFSGMAMPDLVRTSGAASGSPRMRRAAEGIAERLRAGASIEQATQGQAVVPALWSCIASVAAARGELPSALEELARTYEQRARQWIGVTRAILTPILLLLVGLTVGGVLFAMLSAMATIMRSLTGM